MYLVEQNLFSEPKLSSFESLPPELFNAIFDSIHDDFISLKACSMVCHILRPICQARLFYTANLDIFNFNCGLGPTTSHRHFLNTVLSSPYLAPLIQELKFIKGQSLYSPQYRPSQEDKAAHQDVLVQILKGLTNLKTLVIRGKGDLGWDDLSSALKMALFEIVHLPTLLHLDLGMTSGFPASFYNNLTSLQVLRHSGLSLSRDPKMESLGTMDRVKRAHLQILAILPTTPFASIDTLFLHPTSPIDITHLQTLTSAFISGGIICQILKVCGNSLKTLKVHAYYNETRTHKLNLGFQYLQCITSLTLSFSCYCDVSAVLWLDLLVNNLPSPECLKHLTLMFELYPPRISSWSKTTWTALETFLVALPGLRSIRLLFWPYSVSVIDNDKLLTLVRERTDWLADSDIFEVGIIPEFPSFFF